MSGVRGYVVKRCGCRGDDGKQLGSACPKLQGRGHGSWSYVIVETLKGGKRRQQRTGGFKLKRDAETALAEALKVRAQGVRPDRDLTVGDWLDRWIADKTDPDQIGTGGRTLRPGTAGNYRRYVEQLRPHIGELLLADLRDHDIADAYRAVVAEAEEAALEREAEAGDPAYRARRVGPATVNRIHSFLRATLNTAERKRLIPFNPALGVDSLPEERRDPVNPWSPAETKAFLDHASTDRLGPLFEVLARTGMRRGEALGLRWADVDLAGHWTTMVQPRVGGEAQPRRVYVGPSLTITQTWRGLHDQDGNPMFGMPKTDNRRGQVLELTDATVNALKLQQIAQGVERDDWGPGYQQHDLVFAREDGSPINTSTLTKEFHRLIAEAGLRRIRLHDLRHGTASLMLASGSPLEVVSKVLGHSSIGITSAVYSHLLPGVQREASQAAENLLDGQPKTS